ncbi:beta-glucosidase family protein [Nocardioides sp.]|uniref:beta-glucosidase family protein n=1 Tax=Nocardioides sp. TaxID=35761 RepID=UPI002EDAB4CB
MPLPLLRRPRSGRPSARWLAVGATAALFATLAPGGVGTLASASAEDATDCSTVPWMDQTKSADERARSLLDASTQHQLYRWLVEQPANSPQQTDFRGVTYPVQIDCTPTVVYVDGPEGVRAGAGVTTYPGQLSLASTWDTTLAFAKGTQMGDEAFGKRKNVILGPGLSGGRTPFAGRTSEYFGEDPVLSGVLAGAQARGIESNTDKPVLSDLKHYVANEQETDRQTSSSNVGERAFKQIYELSFAIASDEGSPESVMCSYNQVNGVYACENPILQTSLKDQVGFDGYVMSDFGSVHSTAASLNAGMDQELNRPIWFTPDKLDAALAAGEITQQRIEEAAFRVVRSYIRGGLFDHPLPTTAADDVSTTAHKATARRISEQGSVLLKNNGTLPLQPRDGERIAVIGTTAAKSTTEGKSATQLCSIPIPFGSGNTMSCEDLVAPVDALTSRAAIDGTDVVYDAGTDLEQAAAVAADADYVVVFGYEQNGEFSDPADLSLDGNGDALISAVAAANPRTVVVLQTGTAVLMPWLDEVAGVLENWYGGEQMGPAIARLLFGDVSPTGKLPMTFPRSEDQVPTSTDAQYPGLVDGSVVRPDGNTSIRQVDYTEGLEVGYRWYQAEDETPLFPFGYGLSYTDYRYAGVAVQATGGAKRPHLTVRFRLTNRGERAGTELAQVYLELPAKAKEPSARLIGWKKVALASGQTRTVTLHLDARTVARRHLLQYWSTSGDAWRTPSGAYRVLVGGSSEATRSAGFTVK